MRVKQVFAWKPLPFELSEQLALVSAGRTDVNWAETHVPSDALRSTGTCASTRRCNSQRAALS